MLRLSRANHKTGVNTPSHSPKFGAASAMLKQLLGDRVLISLSPAEVALVRLHGTFRPRVVAKRVLACDPAQTAEPWKGAASALATLAAELKGVKARVTVVLSNHFVRYTLVPSSKGLDRPEEELAFAQYHFAKVHGERSKSWDARLSTGPAGAARVASAVDAALLRAIEACFPAGGKARLASVQPYLMCAFNRWRGEIPGKGAWFLLVEPQRSCLAFLEEGRWAAVRNTKGEFDDPAQWTALLDRERHLVASAAPASSVLVHTRNNWKAPAVEAGGWNFRSLTHLPTEGITPGESAPFDLALCAR